MWDEHDCYLLQGGRHQGDPGKDGEASVTPTVARLGSEDTKPAQPMEETSPHPSYLNAILLPPLSWILAQNVKTRAQGLSVVKFSQLTLPSTSLSLFFF